MEVVFLAISPIHAILSLVPTFGVLAPRFSLEVLHAKPQAAAPHS